MHATGASRRRSASFKAQAGFAGLGLGQPGKQRVQADSSQPVGIAWWRVSGYRSGMKKQSFWNVDLVELFKLWISDISTFLMTMLMFMALSLPVVIPGLILWFLWSINWRPG